MPSIAEREKSNTHISIAFSTLREGRDPFHLLSNYWAKSLKGGQKVEIPFSVARQSPTSLLMQFCCIIILLGLYYVLVVELLGS